MNRDRSDAEPIDRDKEPTLGQGPDGGTAAGAAPPPLERPHRARRLGRVLLWCLATLVLLGVLAGAALFATLSTARGTQLAWQAALKVLGPRLSGRIAPQALADGVSLRDVVWQSAGTRIVVDRVEGRWRLSRAPWRVTVDYLRVGTVDVRLAPSPPSAPSGPPKLPERLQSPVQLVLREVRVDRLRLHNGDSVTEFSQLLLAGGTDGRHHRLALKHLGTPWGEASAQLRLDGLKPYTLSGDAAFRGADPKQKVALGVTLTGTLPAPVLDATASGLNLGARAHIEATPFEQVPFTLVALAADHLDPRAVSPGAPQADLTVRAQLRPVSAEQAGREAAAVAHGASTALPRPAMPHAAESRRAAAPSTPAAPASASRPAATPGGGATAHRAPSAGLSGAQALRALQAASSVRSGTALAPPPASIVAEAKVDPDAGSRAPAAATTRAPARPSVAAGRPASTPALAGPVASESAEDYVASAARVPAARERAAAGARLTVAGPISIVNAKPGRLDEGRLPLVDAHAQVRLDAVQQIVQSLTIRLLGDATLRGQGSLRSGHGKLAVDVASLDLSALHASLRKTHLAGPLSVVLAQQGTRVRATLDDRGTALGLRADVSLRADATAIDQLRINAGAGYLDLAGLLHRDATSSYALKATLQRFDPLALSAQQLRPAARGDAKRRAEASVSGTLNASGALTPAPSGKLTFALRDSVYDGLPMTGQGTVQFAGKRLLPSTARLSVAGNDLALDGRFGQASDRLRVDIDARQLDRLGFGLAGRLSAHGEVTGSLAHPNLSANYAADGVSFGAYRVAHAEGRAEVRDGAQGAMNATIEAREVSLPQVALRSLSARLEGTRANHTVSARAQGAVQGHPIDASLAARGGLLEGKGGTGWRGTVNTLSNRGTPSLTLAQPMTVQVQGSHVVLGATRLLAEGATLTLDRLDYQPGRIVSAGRLRAVDVDRMLEVQRALTGTRAALDTDLVVDADWDFDVGNAGRGFLEVRRQSGDVRLSSGAAIGGIGLDRLLARVDFPGGRAVVLKLDAHAARLGTVGANLRSMLSDREGVLGLPPEAPLSGTLNADLPSLRTTGGLLGPQYVLDGRMSMKLSVAGQVGKPRVSGDITGDGLSATLIDSGVQLNRGVIRIGVTENLVELRQVEFHGGEGVLRATGRIRLDGDDQDLSAKIVADKLELFGAPDRQLSLSGQATVANAGAIGGIDIQGKFTVDRALFDLPSSSAPKLGDDVVVIRSDQQRVVPLRTRESTLADKPVGRFAPRSNVVIDLGQHFRFRGVGADLGLVGALTVKSAPNLPLVANGEVRVTEGSTYEAFGRKLAIENGYVLFNGPIGNPALNILAMRRNQEVEAGVRVRGTVRNPEAVLVSEPNVPDNEKLSWLLFGHGTESTTLGQDNTASAALALLGSVGGKRIARSVGLDEFSLGPSTSGLTDPQVVSIAKALNEHFVLGYEQGLTTAATLFKLTWLMSRHWSLAAQTGAINGLALYYTKRFD